MRLLLLVAAPWLLAEEPVKTPPPLEISSEVGYRVLAGQHGSESTYRSVVNLGEGPRLLQFQSTYKPVGSRYLDQFRMTGANWGDPLNSLLLNADKAALYRFNFSYRNLAYFNALPSFASPQLGKVGSEAYTTNQRALDTRQRVWNADLDLLPGRRWQPFLGLAHSGGRGTGVDPLVLDENNYPAASRIDYGYTVLRGGARLELESLHLSLEQGGATFHDGTSLLINTPNSGNREATYWGQTLAVNQASRLYDVTGTHLYSSADLTVSPVAWLDLSAEFYYSRPRSEVQFNEAAQGTILRLDTLRFVNGQQSLANGAANQPRTAGVLTVEARPTSRLRIVDSWQMERMQSTGSLALLTTVDAQALAPSNLSDRLIWRQNEQRIQLFYEFDQRLTVFGGHRYRWGEAEVRRPTLAPGTGGEHGSLSRHSVLTGFIFRPSAKLTFNADSEVGRGQATYFRTSLQNFEQARIRGRYQLSEAWQLTSRYTRLNNRNPATGVNLDFQSQQANATIQWTRKAYTVLADYTRSTMVSDLRYYDPSTERLERSLYRDNAHTATLAVEVKLPRQSQLSFGGSLFRSAGSRPSRFYQPLIRLRVPLSPNAGFLAEWRQASLGQSLFAYEAFGVHQFTIGLRLAR